MSWIVRAIEVTNDNITNFSSMPLKTTMDYLYQYGEWMIALIVGVLAVIIYVKAKEHGVPTIAVFLLATGVIMHQIFSYQIGAIFTIFGIVTLAVIIMRAFVLKGREY